MHISFKKYVLSTLLCLSASISSSAPGDLSVAAENPIPTANSLFGKSLTSEGSNFWIVRPAEIFSGGDGKSRIYKYSEPAGSATLVQTLVNWSGSSDIPPINANDGLLAIQYLRVSPSETTELVSVFDQQTNIRLGTAESPTGEYGFTSVAIFHEKLYIGNPDETVGGQTHVFNLNGTYDKTLFNPHLSAGEDFGFQMAVAAPNRLAILDRSRGIYVYDEDSSRTLELFLNNGFDYRNMAAGSGYVAWSDNAGSKVTIYDAQNSIKVRDIPRPNTAVSYFGETLAISGDLIAVGNPRDAVESVSQAGTVALYRISTGELIKKINNPLMVTNPALAESSNFGAVLAPYRGSFLIGFPEYSPSFATRKVGRVYLLDGESLSGIDCWGLYE